MNFKNNNGITLISLIIYVVIMLMIIALVATFKTNIDKTLDSVGEYTSVVPQINKIHSYMLGETSLENNKILKRNATGSYIEFSSGNNYSFAHNNLYKNSIKILSSVDSCSFETGNENNNNVLYVNVQITGEKPINKTLKYVM